MSDLQYWIDLAECECDSPSPIGACEKCDLQEVQKESEELKSLLDGVTETIEIYAFHHAENDAWYRVWLSKVKQALKEQS